MAERWFKLIIGEDPDSVPKSKRVKRPLMLSDAELPEVEDFELFDGQRISKWNKKSMMWSRSRANDGDATDVLINPVGVPLISSRFRKVLDEQVLSPGEVQWLPVHVLKCTDEEIPGYTIANVLKPVRALDIANSRLLHFDERRIDPETGTPEVGGVAHPALIGKLLKDRSIFRLKEFFPPIFVSERFKCAYDEGQFTGATFREVKVT